MNYFATIFSSTVTIGQLLIAMLTAAGLGLLVSLSYMYKNTHTKGFAASLVVLPVLVTVVIMLVNGNIGAGLAVAGSFSLIKFRSLPGDARDLTSVFTDVAVGLCCGMGYVAIAAVLTLLVLAVLTVLTKVNYGGNDEKQRTLKITIPESLNYEESFKDILENYTVNCELVNVKTASLGSLYKLEYLVTLKDLSLQKEMIDEIRVRNGNLEVSLGKAAAAKGEL
ncbi:MAG: DUF4956 domain-containing protein [Erysipelotrichaceae bacterium]|nr:DUF4956 domain-containing protein [Erysipelotrichaceae bacterium]